MPPKKRRSLTNRSQRDVRTRQQATRRMQAFRARINNAEAETENENVEDANPPNPSWNSVVTPFSGKKSSFYYLRSVS